MEGSSGGEYSIYMFWSVLMLIESFRKRKRAILSSILTTATNQDELVVMAPLETTPRASAIIPMVDQPAIAVVAAS
jgi:hypothetical protein